MESIDKMPYPSPGWFVSWTSEATEFAMLDESVGTKADDGSPGLYDRVDVSAAAVGHVDIDIMCTRKVVGVGATSTSSGWVCRRSTFGEMIRPFIYLDRNLTTRLENKR